MKCIKVRIDQLGRIRNSEILVSPLMVFSGESGLGKSYLALLCHYFFELLINTSRLNHFFVDNNIDFNILAKDFKDVGTALEIKNRIWKHGWQRMLFFISAICWDMMEFLVR